MWFQGTAREFNLHLLQNSRTQFLQIDLEWLVTLCGSGTFRSMQRRLNVYHWDRHEILILN